MSKVEHVSRAPLQVPLLPVFADVMLQPASFLSHYLPASVDANIPRNFTRQVCLHALARQVCQQRPCFD